MSAHSTTRVFTLAALAPLALAMIGNHANAQQTSLKKIQRARMLASSTTVGGNHANSSSLLAITVPWLGDPNLAHQVFDGGTLILQGVAIVPVGNTLTAATWDPGDGTGPVAIPFTNARDLELSHVYHGVNNQPYLATLSVTDNTGATSSDTFRVVVATKKLDVEVNMAIDSGLWYLHKREVLSSVNGVPTGSWIDGSSNRAATTGSAVQAFETNGHLQTGNPLEDPYIDDVARGLAHLPTELTVTPISVQTAGDPDSNGNGFGLETGISGESTYVTAQVIDAFVASGTPNVTALTGDATHVLGRTYADLVQDMIDVYAFGQVDSGYYEGGWRYGWNSDSDNSAAQWMAIGGIAAERVFNTKVPAFVKTENAKWLTTSQVDSPGSPSDGCFGYTSTSPIWANGMNTTPSGLVQMILDGVQDTNPHFQAAEHYMVLNWSYLSSWNTIYGMYATAKAMRLALPAPIQLLDGTFDWYNSDTTTGGSVDGLARLLVKTQLSDGSWSGYYTGNDLSAAWAVIILHGNIVTVGPVAVAHAEPDTAGKGDNIKFDGSQSFHLDPSKHIVKWDWDFDNDGVTDASGQVVNTSFSALGDFPVRLTVTDDTQPVPLTASTVVTIHIIIPPFPPNSDPGGPYTFCQGKNQTLILDGSKSSDIDGQVVAWEWDFSPFDGVFGDATTPLVDATAYYSGVIPGIYDVGLRVTDNVTLQNTDYTTVNVIGPNGQCNVGGNQPPDCSGASTANVILWPADHKFVKIDVAALAHITDPNGDPFTVSIDSITQDELVDAPGPSDGKTKPDAEGVHKPIAWIRAERKDKGNGRVYHINFTAIDNQGAFCQNTLVVTVPKEPGLPAVDDGQCCDSTQH